MGPNCTWHISDGAGRAAGEDKARCWRQGVGTEPLGETSSELRRSWQQSDIEGHLKPAPGLCWRQTTKLEAQSSCPGHSSDALTTVLPHHVAPALKADRVWASRNAKHLTPPPDLSQIANTQPSHLLLAVSTI